MARLSAHWHQLLDLCALTGTLIADGDGSHSPADFNDRLLLRLKGTMSEAELHLIRSRLRGGLEKKAARGELPLPIGLERDEDGEIRLSRRGLRIEIRPGEQGLLEQDSALEARGVLASS